MRIVKSSFPIKLCWKPDWTMILEEGQSVAKNWIFFRRKQRFCPKNTVFGAIFNEFYLMDSPESVTKKLTESLCDFCYCETQPPASIGWVALSSVVRSVGCLSRIGDISSHLHYMMFPSIQTIYFLWGYDPGNMTVSTYLLLLSWAQFTVV